MIYYEQQKILNCPPAYLIFKSTIKEKNMDATMIIGLIIGAIVGAIIAQDANSRGMNGLAWGVFTFLICIVAIPIYLIVRKPRQNE